MDRLEQATKPAERTWLSVGHDETTGRYWLDGNKIDYRAAIGGPGAQGVTPAQFAELEKNHRILLTVFKTDFFRKDVDYEHSEAD